MHFRGGERGVPKKPDQKTRGVFVLSVWSAETDKTEAGLPGAINRSVNFGQWPGFPYFYFQSVCFCLPFFVVVVVGSILSVKKDFVVGREGIAPDTDARMTQKIRSKAVRQIIMPVEMCL